VRGVLQAAGEELHDCPLYLDLHSVCASLKCTPMKHDVFRSALLNAGG
jgi:tRNA (guanine26-N2/guanine27-N2)-dimethyltransferase